MNCISPVFSLLVGIFFCYNVFSQEPILEDYTPIDSLVVKDYETLGNFFYTKVPFYNVDPDSLMAHDIAMAYLWKAQKDQDSLQLGKGYNLLGISENFRIDYFDKAIFYLKKLNDKSFLGNAYHNKFYFYYDKGDYKEASKMLVKALEYIKDTNNLRYIYNFKFNINSLNIDWGDKEAAIAGFKEIRELLYSSKFDFISLEEKAKESMDIHYNIAKAYYYLNNYTAAKKHLDILYEYDEKNIEDQYKTEYLGLKSAIFYRQKKYKEALDLINEYFNYLDIDELYGLSSSYIIKGLILWELDKKEEAIQEIYKADSLYQITDDIFEELGEGYQLLVNYYKEEEDTENQLLYLNKLIEFDKEISSNYIEIGNRIAQEYTIPTLLSEKEEAIKKLNRENTLEKKFKGMFLSLLVCVSLIASYFIYRSYWSKKKFMALMQQYEESKIQHIGIPKPILKKSEPQELDEKQLARISKGLKKFETSKGYLDSGVTLQSLAKSIDTNSSYLSKYINTVKEANFSKYINTLRVNYAIYKLQSDPKFCFYTIEAMASKVGFSNMRSFTNYFKKETGLTVSYFIKNLSKTSASTT